MRVYEDSYKHKGWRKKLVDELVAKGIDDKNVLKAIETVPRHFLLDAALDHLAYENRSIPIGEEQTISQPSTVAFQTQLLDVKISDKILEVGTGSGYQSTILAELGAIVYTIERQKKLYQHLQANNPFAAKYKFIKYFYGDGFEGLPTFAPFDKIIITCGAPNIPPKLVQQLKVGGIMIVPQTIGDKQLMKKITKLSDAEFSEQEFGDFLFVPMLTGRQK
jgi:protein-L-isoaspartate(D-aspartate) O-methyltransferase